MNVSGQLCGAECVHTADTSGLMLLFGLQFLVSSVQCCAHEPAVLLSSAAWPGPHHSVHHTGVLHSPAASLPPSSGTWRACRASAAPSVFCPLGICVMPAVLPWLGTLSRCGLWWQGVDTHWRMLRWQQPSTMQVRLVAVGFYVACPATDVTQACS